MGDVPSYTTVCSVLERQYLNPRGDRDAFGFALPDEAQHRRHVEGEAALVLMEADGDALRAPVRKERLHVGVDLRRTDDQLRAVADLLLPLVRCDQVWLLDRGAESQVADG